MDSFESLGLAEPLSAALESFGFAGATPIQSLAIPLLLARRDAFIEAETGTGKTFAYLAPAFQTLFASSVANRGSGEPGILVAAPTQELAVQIGREATKLAQSASLNLKTAVLLGGTPLDKLSARLRERPDLVIGTLGRLGDLISLGKLKLSSLHFLVLDEADRLLAPETVEQALALIKAVPESCARILVSATLPEKLRRAMRPLLRDAVEPRVTGEAVLSGSIEHWCFYCDGRKRLDFVRRLEAALRPERCLVFLSAASRVEDAAQRLAAEGLPIAGIHAGMEKEERRVALERFAAGELRYLLTSDLGARGLDIAAVSHIVSLDLPEEPTIYTHRAGRTGRAGATGISIILADGVELARASKIAVRGKFVFRCKFLESGAVFEPTPAEFFARVNAAEEERFAARAAREGGDERRRPPRPAPARAGHWSDGGGRRDDMATGRGEAPAPRPRADDAKKGDGFYLRKKPAPSAAVSGAPGEAARPFAHEAPGRPLYPRRDDARREGQGGERSGDTRHRGDRRYDRRPGEEGQGGHRGHDANRGPEGDRGPAPYRTNRKPGGAPFRKNRPDGEKRGS